MEGSSRRHAPARVAVLACALFLALGSVPGVLAAPGVGPAPSRVEIDSAAAFRVKLGFRADRAFVAATFGKAAFSKAKWGVPLDAAESAEVGRRVKLQKEAGRALETWASEPGAAGAYFDHTAKGAPVFLTTRDPAKAKVAVARVMPSGANARFLRVSHSMAELLAVQVRVNADVAAGVLAPLGVLSTSIDARANAVVVGLAADSADVRAALATRYGDAVRAAFELPSQGGDACTSRDECGPAKGGIKIISSYNGNPCTMGFLARVVGSPNPRVLTAGHCIGKSGGTGASRKWSHDGLTTWAEFDTWTNGADADVGVLAADGSAISGARNLVFRASKWDIASVTSWATTAQQVQGGLVCRAAAISGYRCGTIIQTNRTKSVDGRTIDHQWVVDFDACPGDSGGPYLLGTVAYGLHSDSTVGCEPGTNQAWYSPIGWVLDVLRARGHPVELCTTASCGGETNAWTLQGTLADEAWRPQVVPLEDGRVMLAGGTSGNLLAADAGDGPTSVPQVFDPETGAWTNTADPPWLPATCAGQFAVRIADGRVLVGGGRKVGGPGDADACAGAHLYDPDDGGDGGSWSSVASPPAVVESAGAVLLADGRVFVTGGAGADGATPLAMAWDPGEDAWATLAAPPAGAFAPLAILLPDDRVFVSGGYVVADAAGPGYADVSATHLYDPALNAWTSTSEVGTRGAAATVLANGRLVLAGGMHQSWDGTQETSLVATVRQLDPATGSWTTLASLPTARGAFSLAALSDGILIAAGGLVSSGGSNVPSRTAAAWDPAGNAWRTVPSLNVHRAEQGTAVLDDGSLLVVGGGTATTERYVLGDLLPPSVGTPGTSLRSLATMSTTSIPVRIWWSASDDGGSGVGWYDVARSKDGGAFSTIATKVIGTGYSTTVQPGHDYRFRVRPRDYAGNVGAWMNGPEVRTSVTQQTSSSITFSSGWTTASAVSYAGGSAKYATSAGRSASYTFTGRGIAFVSLRAPTRGAAKIYIDGSLAATVSLQDASTTARYIPFQRYWTSSGKHTSKDVVVGSTGHPRIDVAAFVGLTNP